MTEDKKDKRKEKIQKILKHAAPLIIGASSILPWSPVCSGSVKMSKDKNNIEIPAAKPASHNNDTPKLALADKNSLFCPHWPFSVSSSASFSGCAIL